MANAKTDNSWLWLLLILILAAQLRFYGLDFGKPFTFHPDETKLVSQAGRLLDTKFMDKDAYFGIRVYPPFFTYILAAAMGGYIVFNLLTGRFDSLAAVKTAYQTDSFQFIMVSRSLVVLFGVGLVLLIYLIGARLYSKKVGLLAALLSATSFALVRNSHFGTVDIPATFLGMAVIYFCINVMQKGRSRDYILAALFIALATATKFSMLLFVLPLVYAHMSRYKWQELARAALDKKIWLAAAACLLFFLVACPLIWLDFKETWGGIIGTSRFESVGKVGSGGGLLSYWTGDQSAGFGVFYPNSIPGLFGAALTVIAALGVVYLLIRRRKSDWLLLFCLVPVYFMFEKMSIKAMRHILPIIPILILAATIFLADILDRVKGKLGVVLTALTFGILAVTQTAAAVSYHKKLKAPDPRAGAATWLKQNVPAGAAVAVEAFPPCFAANRDSSGYTIYETNWTSRSKTRRAEFMQFVAEKDSIFYIADDFTRQTFSWKYTKAKYPDLARDRLEFFQWLEESAEKIKVFQSDNNLIQPTITIYRLLNPKTDQSEEKQSASAEHDR